MGYLLESGPATREQLRLVVRTREYLAMMQARIGSDDSIVWQPLSGDLVSICYRDLPNARRPILKSDLATLRLDEAEALSACRRASKAALQPLSSYWADLSSSSLGSIQTGDDVTGYLAVPEDWAPLARRLGSLVVAVPSIDAVL
jgi:hypothetical protein